MDSIALSMECNQLNTLSFVFDLVKETKYPLHLIITDTRSSITYAVNAAFNSFKLCLSIHTMAISISSTLRILTTSSFILILQLVVSLIHSFML